MKVNILEHSIFKHSEYLFLNPSWKLWDIFENVWNVLKPFRKSGTFWLLLTIFTLDSQLLNWLPIRSPSFETPSPYSFHTTYSTTVAPNQNLLHHGWKMESYCTTPYKSHEALYGEGGLQSYRSSTNRLTANFKICSYRRKPRVNWSNT